MILLRKNWVSLTAATLLLLMFVVMVSSARGDSAIRDEMPHIAAGYSYLTTGDYRINPEHPPLIKDLAAVPLLALNLNFPTQFWAQNLNSQWDLGHKFLYEMGNNADQMLFWARLPIILLSLLLGYFVFRWARELYGDKAGLLALTLYAFDANIIAHSRFVTTDLGIGAAFFIHLYFLWKFLKNPTWKWFLVSGLTFGVVLVTKFSAALLLPIYFLVFLYLLFRKPEIQSKIAFFKDFAAEKIFKRGVKIAISFVSVAALGVAFMYLFYIPHTANMTSQIQHAVINENLPPEKRELTHKIADVSKPLAQYFLGFQMVNAHVTTGHQTYLLGEVANGFKLYYPVTLAVKTPIPEMVLVLLTLLLWRRFGKKDYFSEFLLLLPVAVFVGIAIQGSLNLGIRYLLPIFPFLFVFVSKYINLIDFKTVWDDLRHFKNLLAPRSLGAVGLAVLVSWQIAGSLAAYPSYLSYFNEAAIASGGGIKYISDSNLDWGQDLKRLVKYVEENKIEKIKIDYFGGGDPQYYLGDKAELWSSQKGRPLGWFAISASTYTQATAKWANGSKKGQVVDQTYYDALANQKPKAVIGGSILVFELK